MKKSFSFLTIALVMVTALVVGCSPNQWAAKEVVDGTGIEQGERVTIQQNNGESVSGTFVGISTMPMDEYEEYYASASQETGAEHLLPALGQHIRLSTSLSSEKAWNGELVGFSDKSLLVKLDGKSEPDEIYASSVTRLSGREGEPLRFMEFRKLFLNGEIPMMTTLLLRDASGEIQVPVNSIRELTVHQGLESAAGRVMNGDQIRYSLNHK